MSPSDYESIGVKVPAADILPGKPVTARLEMSAEDRADLADALDVPRVDRVEGEIKAARRAGLIEVEGRIIAKLVRACVVSLEEMDEEIDETFAVTFTEEQQPAREGEFEADLDAPEPIEGGVVDFGAVLLEQLVLAMDPHPRIEGAAPVEDPGAGARISPFDVLERLKSES
jgi:uncharacterized metal-binding protein YceD (DUF177 family)